VTGHLLIAVSALILAAAATPLARHLAPLWGFVDRPSERKVHRTTMPRLGGVAIYLSFIVAFLIFGERFYVRQLVGILLGATLVSGIGLWDDRRSLRAVTKLLAQLAAAGILIVSGVRVQALHQPVLDVLVTVVWVVGITNAINLLDNMDGLSGSVSAVAAAYFLLLAAMSGQYLVGALAAALLGACLGFLIYNVNPASIFMGDSGALFLGFMLAAVGIKLRFPTNSDVITWMVPVLVLALPIFDVTLVSVSRLRRGLNPLTTPGMDHTSHRLVALGLTPREAVLTLTVVASACGMLATYVTQASLIDGYAVGALAALAGLAAIIWLEVNPRTRPRSR
jgi:UDP-GlcNAc:undecaprenyl-phosphate GlcNAc-1-phosphate transferase